MPDEMSPPKVMIISGPDGAGKSTAAPELLQGALAVNEFVNADVIARGLSAFEPEKVALPAGRIMLERLAELAAARQSFAFETTLASRTLAPFVRKLKASGYLFHLVYLWLPSAEMAISRVEVRVQRKGHHVPDEIVRRRYERGLRNLFELYRPLATTWGVYYSASPKGLKLVAESNAAGEDLVHDVGLWASICREGHHEQNG
jgi:predicted ABC-type ATPase